MIARALPIALAGATVAVTGATIDLLIGHLILKLRPPEGFGYLPSPPRPFDYQLLASLRWLAFVALGAFPVALVLAGLGEDAGYVEALVAWTKGVLPFAVVFVLDSAWEVAKKDRVVLSALLRERLAGEELTYEPPVPRSSSLRVRGVAYTVAIFAGIVLVNGLPDEEPTRFISPAPPAEAPADPPPSGHRRAEARPAAGAAAVRPPRVAGPPS